MLSFGINHHHRLTFIASLIASSYCLLIDHVKAQCSRPHKAYIFTYLISKGETIIIQNKNNTRLIHNVQKGVSKMGLNKLVRITWGVM